MVRDRGSNAVLYLHYRNVDKALSRGVLIWDDEVFELVFCILLGLWGAFLLRIKKLLICCDGKLSYSKYF